jgi:hypothetical protein
MPSSVFLLNAITTNRTSILAVNFKRSVSEYFEEPKLF